MGYGLTVSTPPATEPVSVGEAKTHLRVETDAEDGYISTLIRVARTHAESYTRRALINQTLQLTLDSFPCDGVIRIPRNPVSAISSVGYVDEQGDAQTVSSSLYRLDETSIVARLTPSYGETWPTTQLITKAVTVTFVAGYGSSDADVPEPIRHAILLMVGTYYDPVRENVVLVDSPQEVPQSSQFLLGPYRIPELDPS